MAQMATKNPLEFFRQVRQEVAKVTWPTRKETWLTTAMVFVMVVLASIFFLAVDATLGHPGQASDRVAEPFHDRPRRLAAGKGDRQPGAILHQAQRGKATAVLADDGEQIWWHQMAVNVDDHDARSFPA